MTKSGIPQRELERRESVEHNPHHSDSRGVKLSIDRHTARLAVVGTGRIGATLARSLVAAGWSVSCVMGSTAESPSAHRIARELGCHVASGPRDVGKEANVILFCVPDAALETAVSGFARSASGWQGSPPARMVGHTCGSRGISVLSPLTSLGWEAFALHPVVSIADPGSRPEVLKGKYAGITATIGASPLAYEMARSLGMRPFDVAEEHRRAYHLACSITSNFLVTLVALAEKITCRVGIREGAEVFVPLLKSTLDNLGRLSPARALTGPIARGDTSTVAAHLEELEATLPEAIPCYIELAAATSGLAALDETERSQIQALLSEWRFRSLEEPEPPRAPLDRTELQAAVRGEGEGYEEAPVPFVPERG